MKSARPLRRPTSRWLSLIICLCLILSCLSFVPFETAFRKRSIPFLPRQGQQNGSPNGQGRRVTPIPPQPGPPTGNLPNLDELRSRTMSPPVQAPPPIPSTRRAYRKYVVPPGLQIPGVGLPLGLAGKRRLDSLAASVTRRARSRGRITPG